MTLSPYPGRRILVPLVTAIGQAAERGFDVVPAPFVVQTALDELGDERAPAAGARTPVDLGHEIVVQGYVQTHGRNNSMLRIAC